MELAVSTGTCSTILHYFVEQVKNRPKKIAIKTKTNQLTYQDLDNIANNIAQAILAQLPTNSADRVAMLLPQDYWAIAVILGILKAGKIYVPLDPQYPKARTTYILQDSATLLIVTDNSNLPLAQELAGNSCLIINIEKLNLVTYTTPVEVALTADAIAYIIYTSGSTGEPKGVIQTHKNLYHFIKNYTKGLQINEDDRLTFFYSFSFSASLMDIFGALLSGATLYPYALKEEGLSDLAAWLIKEEITIYHSVPTVYRHFTDSLNGDEKFPKLRCIDLGGEIVYRNDVDRCRKHFAPNCILVNHLAATELSVIAQYPITATTEITSDPVPVGYISEGTEITLIGDDGKEVSQGEVGEIVIKSEYLSPGYWHKPELTNTLFSQDPFTNTRCYYTSDLGRLRTDGLLEYLGRKDFRIKLRGHSIEAAEIETALLAIEKVKASIVTALDDNYGQKHLVAYLVTEQSLLPIDLREALATKLPDYMIPNLYIFLDTLPLTPNGKVDRAALPTPAWQQRATSKVLPRNELETHLTKIWAEILNIPTLGVTDNFFLLGGSSLQATKLFKQVKKFYQKTLTPAMLLQAPTIEELAQLINQKEPITFAALVGTQVTGTKTPLFFITGAGYDNTMIYPLGRFLSPEQPVYGMQLAWGENNQKTYTRIEEMAGSFIPQIQSIQPHGPYYLGGYSFGGIVAYEIAQQLSAQGEKVATVIALDTYGPNYPPPTSLAKKVNYVLGNFRKLSAKKKFDYFIQKSRNVLMGIKVKFWGKLYGFYLSSHRQVPPILKNILSDNDRTFIQALTIRRFYHALGYQGRMDLFLAEETRTRPNVEPHLGWNQVIKGQLKIHNVPGSHATIIKEPHLEILAQSLKKVLDELEKEMSKA